MEKSLYKRLKELWLKNNWDFKQLGYHLNYEITTDEYRSLDGDDEIEKAKLLISEWESEFKVPEDCSATISPEQLIREFQTGASRDTDEGKLDFEGFLSPPVLKVYAEYMHKNRIMRDGSMRDSDNWQKGIPIKEYMKSMWRHFFDVWSTHRGIETKEDQVTNLCAMLFNVSGMLHETLKETNE